MCVKMGLLFAVIVFNNKNQTVWVHAGYACMGYFTTIGWGASQVNSGRLCNSIHRSSTGTLVLQQLNVHVRMYV